MKLEEILKAAGWSDADIAAMAPMLADARFRESIERQYGAVATERDALKGRDAEWARLKDEEWQPRVNDYEKQLTDARLENAQLRERMKLAKDFGYVNDDGLGKIDEATRKAEEERNKSANGFDPAKWISKEEAAKLMDAEGRAIAMMSDLSAEYSRLYPNQTLFDYETEIDGRVMRGASALRVEAMAKRMPLDRYVAEKFDFSGKRQALKEQRQKEHDDAIRKEAEAKVRQELAEQYGNPMMRTAVPSRHAQFIPKPESGGAFPTGTKAEQKAARIERAMKAQMSGAPN